MRTKQLFRRLARHRGAAIIFVAFVLFLLIAMAGLAIDVGYVYTVRNELQNAADAAALAGAQVLYDDPTTTADDPPGSHVNPNANGVALDFLNQNYSEKVQVTPESIERGHWSFATRTFTTNETDLDPVDLWNVSEEALDANPHFINAVRVVTQRKRDAAGQLPEPFLARIFGGQAKEINGVAVAYIGFAGTLAPFEADQPIAICQDSILDPDTHLYNCNRGRMINSGQNAGVQTGGWTNFTQGPCVNASTPTVRPLVCANGNPNEITLGEGIGAVNGQIQTVYDDLLNCWLSVPGIDQNNDGWPDQPWTLKLPVITCDGNTVHNCDAVVGAVVITVVWITRTDNVHMDNAPRLMGNWTGQGANGDPGYSDGTRCTGTGPQCWQKFAEYFRLKQNLSNDPAIYQDKTLYFLPDCAPQKPAGLTGGRNFGVLAKIPVLVNPYTLVKDQ
jgi:hypothetical protein